MTYDNMVKRNREVNAEKARRAKRAIQDMLDKQEPVTVAALARKTGLSREFFYKNEELRKVLTQARKQQDHIVFQRPQMAAIDKAMEMHLKELQKELAKVREENKTLKAENEKLKAALKKRDLKILRGL